MDAAGARARFAAILDQLPAVVAIFRGPDLVLEFANPLYRALAPGQPVMRRPVREAIRDVLAEPALEFYIDLLEHVYESGQTYYGRESPVRLPDPQTGEPADRFFDTVFVALRGPAGEIEGVIVHAVEVTEQVLAKRQAEEAERRYSALVEANVVGVTITDAEHIYEANDAFLELIGRTRAELESGLRWTDLTPREWHQADARAMSALVEHGAAPPYEKEYLCPDGSRVPVLLSGMRVQQEPLRVLATVYDLSDQKKVEAEIADLLERERDARQAAERVGARMGRLQEVTATVSASISPAEIARAVVHHALEDLSASAGVLALAEGADVTLGYSIGYDRARLAEWSRFPLSSPTPVSDAIRSGEPVIVSGVEDWESRYPDVSSGARQFDALVAMPLVAGGHALGALGLSFRDGRDLSAEDQDFLRSLAQQAAAALERAKLFENRAYVARKLQEGLLPDHLDPVPGVEAAVRYTSISGGGEVGGDFYDLFRARENRWMLAIGDVCGKGTEAAVITGLARHTVRAIAALGYGPADVLGFLNEAIRRQASVPAFCTVGCAMLERAGERELTARIASGGHPYPYVLRAGGELEEVEVHGTMLGVTSDPQLEEIELRLGPGDALIVYTDGVIDARRPRGERFGEERLRAALSAAAGRDAEGIAGAIEQAVRQHHPDAPSDDRAVVVVRVSPRARSEPPGDVELT